MRPPPIETAPVGGDGIGGVSVLASETFEADGPAKRPRFHDKKGMLPDLQVCEPGVLQSTIDKKDILTVYALKNSITAVAVQAD